MAATLEISHRKAVEDVQKTKIITSNQLIQIQKVHSSNNPRRPIRSDSNSNLRAN